MEMHSEILVIPDKKKDFKSYLMPLSSNLLCETDIRFKALHGEVLI